jgi:hypothetical protein
MADREQSINGDSVTRDDQGYKGHRVNYFSFFHSTRVVTHQSIIGDSATCHDQGRLPHKYLRRTPSIYSLSFNSQSYPPQVSATS